MKKLFRTMIAVAVAAAAMTSCAKEMQEIVQENGVPFQVTMQGPDTKAIFGTAESSKYPVLWQEGDEVKVMALKTPGSKTDVAVVEGKKYTVTVANEGKSASFTAECPAAATAPYQFFVLSPNSAFVSCGDDATNKDYIQYTVPASQTPTATSVDPAAIITLGVSTQSADIPGAINLTFKHLTAYGLLTLNNLTTGGKAVKSISLTFDESLGISGRWMYHPSTDATNVNNKGNVITVNTDKTENVYFSCAPVDISGTKITVTVAVEGSNLIKEITVPADKAFKAGTVSKFAIDMTGATEEAAKVFAPVAVSDLSTLKAGDQLIIASVGAIGDMGRVACSTTQATANRTGISVGTLINEEGKLVNPTSGVQIVTLKEGTIEGCFLLEVGEGQYLYCPGVTKKNQLKTTTDLVTDNDAANWKIYADGEKTRIASQVKSDWAGDAKPNRIYIEFNKDDGKCSSYPIDSQSAACLFRLEGEPTPKVPALERVWGFYKEGDTPWYATTNITAVSIAHPDGYGMARSLAMDDEYIYLPKSSGYANVAAVSISDKTVQKALNKTGVSGGSTFATSFVRMIKNTDAAVNGGNDVLLLCNLSETSTDANQLRLYAYKDGVDAAPTQIAGFCWDAANNTNDWRRYGDRFFVTGDWTDGKVYFPSYNQPKTVVLNIANGARTSVTQIHAGENSPNGIKDLTVYPGDNKLFLTNTAIANLVAPTSNKLNGWDEFTLSGSSTNGVNTWGYNFFEFNGKKYIAYARIIGGTKAQIEVIEDKGDLLSSLSAKDGLLVSPIHDATDLNKEVATGNLADCCVRTINGVTYIAALTRDGGFVLDKFVLK